MQLCKKPLYILLCSIYIYRFGKIDPTFETMHFSALFALSGSLHIKLLMPRSALTLQTILCVQNIATHTLKHIRARKQSTQYFVDRYCVGIYVGVKYKRTESNVGGELQLLYLVKHTVEP